MECRPSMSFPHSMARPSNSGMTPTGPHTRQTVWRATDGQGIVTDGDHPFIPSCGLVAVSPSANPDVLRSGAALNAEVAGAGMELAAVVLTDVDALEATHLQSDSTGVGGVEPVDDGARGTIVDADARSIDPGSLTTDATGSASHQEHQT